MKALITGSEGFVGRYLRAELAAHGYTAVGLDVQGGAERIADLSDPAAAAEAVRACAPDAVFHLAGQANVALSWKEPALTFERNTLACVHLLEAVRAHAPAARVLLVGSSDEYGSLGERGARVSEETPLQPCTPYAVSKHAQEELAAVYARAYGLHVCCTRSFNHCGAGQRRGFLFPDLAAGIARVERGEADALRVGNLTSRRDYTNVRDIARAYRLLSERGEAGQVYNVGSGRAYSGQEILDLFLSFASRPVRVEQDEALLRPSDTPVVCCDRTKLSACTGWEPRIPPEETAREVLAEWRERL